MRALPILIAVSTLGLSACGIDAEKYNTKYAEAYCDWALECLDAPVLSSNGWTDLDTCVPDFGGRFAASKASCQFDSTAAKQCLKAMKKYDCAGAPDVPELCDVAYICEGATDDSGI